MKYLQDNNSYDYRDSVKRQVPLFIDCMDMSIVFKKKIDEKLYWYIDSLLYTKLRIPLSWQVSHHLYWQICHLL